MSDFPCCDPGGSCRPDGIERVEVDPDLLESRLRVARLMSYGPLTDG